MSPQLLRRKKAALRHTPTCYRLFMSYEVCSDILELQLAMITHLLVSKKDRYTSMKLLGPDNQWKANELEHYPSLLRFVYHFNTQEIDNDLEDSHCV